MENSMRSIAKALNNIAIAISNLAKVLTPATIDPQSKVNAFPVSSTITSNPGNPNVKITSIYQNKNYAIAHISHEEKLAFDAVYSALTDKGNHPDHHDHIMRELSTKWPVLHKALKQLVVARKESYNRPSSDIWKNNKANKNIW
jgi:hypothetical protein